MLAYLFWHRPRDPAAVEEYEHAQAAFHRSLAHNPPVGLCGSACFRVAELPWLGAFADDRGSEAAPAPGGYEDWYLIEDFAALGVLNEAAVGRGHRSAHDQVARRFGVGAGGMYGLLEGERPLLGEGVGAERGGVFGAASLAVWVSRPPGSSKHGLADLLTDGIDPRHASLWRRQLVLGPAPEFCLLLDDRSQIAVATGVSPTRLPPGWTATILDREPLGDG